ncbi:LysR family transcriptional regulator [Herbaspirillum chlorophenolicum]|uniref:LysR family transcriptional regulator n=1 Tax=Herbaspirillum chlorophenolicum TaxID=211589 RepID=A0ABW8ETE8_9BURK|nr:LysR family transcriptional regulator [Herbaspirillum chlorophenolicum]
MAHFDLNVLRTLTAVADAGSFTKAANLVHRTQSAVSMQIKELEEALGKPLFIRDTRKVSLTSEGRKLLAYARRMLALNDEAWASIVRPDVTGKVTIGVPEDFVSSLLPPVLRKFSGTYPKVQIQVVCVPSMSMMPLLKDNKIDLACVTKDKELSGDFIRQEPMNWVCSQSNPALWKQRPLPIAMFERSVARNNAMNALKNAGIKFRTHYSSQSLLGLITMVDASLAIAALAECSVPDRLIKLGRDEGLPDLEPLEIVLARSSDSSRPPCDYLAEQIFQELYRPVE